MIRVADLDEAIAVQNSSRLGLTGGIHSLDPAEIAHWRESVEVGNAYINRSTTGAIVQRQPFGGWKDSSVGPGVKAGGTELRRGVPRLVQRRIGRSHRIRRTRSLDNTTGALIKSLQKHVASDLHAILTESITSYSHWWQHEFSVEHDPSNLHGETNDFCYRPQPQHVLRISAGSQLTPEDFLAIARVLAACQITNCPLFISLDQSVEAIEAMLAEVSWAMAVQVRTESTEGFVKFLQSLNHGTLRILGDYQLEQFAPSVIGKHFQSLARCIVQWPRRTVELPSRTSDQRNRAPLRKHLVVARYILSGDLKFELWANLQNGRK